MTASPRRPASTRISKSSRPSTSTTGILIPYSSSSASSPVTSTSRYSNGVRARTAMITSRASSHSPHPGRANIRTSGTHRMLTRPGWGGSRGPACGRKQPVDEDDRHDLELHRLVSARERPAFDELYRRYGRSAYGVALRVTSQDLIAQEVVQDAFLALWRAPEAFDPARGAFRSFFLSLVHHRAVDAVRREERLKRRTERAANLEPATGEDPAEDVVEDAYLRVRRKEVRAALTTLPQAQQQVLEIAYFEGKTQVRIAEELGIPIGTVKTRTLAAMRKLREALREEEGS